MTTRAIMTRPADKVVSAVIAALTALRRFRLRMRGLPLPSRDSPHEQPRERVYYERDYEQYQPQLHERVLMQGRLRLVEFVGDGRRYCEPGIEQRSGYLGPVAYD